MAKRQKKNQYRSGLLGNVPTTGTPLPGTLAQTSLHDAETPSGTPFCIVRFDRSQVCTIVISVQPDGSALVDQETIDTWVAFYGDFLNSLADEPYLIGAAITIETSPESGAGLRKHISTALDPDAPDFARGVLADIANEYPMSTTQVSGFVSLTYAIGYEKNSFTDLARVIAPRIPAICERLSFSGAGATNLMTRTDLCRYAREAYDPVVAAKIEQQALDENTSEVESDWEHCGPIAAEAGWDTYRHDSGMSQTLLMTDPPKGIVREQILARLLSPHRDIDRKRVTLFYKPVDPAEAASMVERQLNRAASAAASTKKAANYKAIKRRDDADLIARDEATGSGITNFGMGVTVTVTDPERLKSALAAIDILTGSARIRMRPAFGSQDSAFAAMLPFGAVSVRSALSTRKKIYGNAKRDKNATGSK